MGDKIIFLVLFSSTNSFCDFLPVDGSPYKLIRGLTAGLALVKDVMYCAQNYEISDHHHHFISLFIKPLSSILPPFPTIVLI